MKKKKKNKGNKKRNIIVISILVLIVAGIFLKFVFSSGVKPVEVTVEPVAKREIVHKVTASGKIQPEKQVEISANISALIMEISVDEGDSVMMGQHLISLDRMRYEAASEQALSRLKSAEANLVKNTAMRDRAEKLFSEQLISSQEIESSTASFQLAESDVEMTRASLKSAMDDLSKTSLLAPSNGIVTEVRKEEGEMALGSMFQADVIMSIADLSKMEVNVDVNENDVVSIEIGDTSEIEIDAFQDTLFYGVVTEIAHVAQTSGLGTQEQVTNFKVKVRMIDVPEGIRPGMSATANIVTDKRVNALAIPIQSLTVRPVGSEKQMSPDKGVPENESEERSKAKVQEFEELIFILADEPGGVLRNDELSKPEGLDKIKSKGDTKYVHIRPVKVGISSETHYEILSGLEEGEQIVIGSYRAISKDLSHNKAVTTGEDGGENKKGFRIQIGGSSKSEN